MYWDIDFLYVICFGFSCHSPTVLYPDKFKDAPKKPAKRKRPAESSDEEEEEEESEEEESEDEAPVRKR